MTMKFNFNFKRNVLYIPRIVSSFTEDDACRLPLHLPYFHEKFSKDDGNNSQRNSFRTIFRTVILAKSYPLNKRIDPVVRKVNQGQWRLQRI